MADTVFESGEITGNIGFLIGQGAGASVAGAGDVNGDGIEDILLGAPGSSNPTYMGGSVYVIFGKVGTDRASTDLGALAPADGLVIKGLSIRGYAGYSVSSAGDVNGDGFDDIAIGVPGDSAGGSRAGGAYVVFGGPGTLAAGVDLAHLQGRGFFVQGDAERDYAGTAVASAGDVNGDGIDDILVGARGNDVAGQNAGATYVIFGKAGNSRENIDLSSLAAQDGFAIFGEVSTYTGVNLASAGDINGDGLDDIIIGAPVSSPNGQSSGQAYVILGKTGAARGSIELSDLGAGDGFAIQGPEAFRQAGAGVSSAGDINGDGIDDFVVGAPYDRIGNLPGGGAYVLFGKVGGARDTIDLAEFSDDDGFLIRGDKPNDMLGFSAAAAGDINGDGLDDIVISAPYSDARGDRSGTTYIIFGKAGANRADIDVSDLARDDGIELNGGEPGARFGRRVGSGDFNDDGLSDVLIGAGSRAYVFYGNSSYGPSGAPRAKDDVLHTLVNTPISVMASELLVNDSSGIGTAPLRVASVQNANGGTAVLKADGSVSFTPDPGFIGPASFDYVVSDGNLTDVGQVVVRVRDSGPLSRINLGGLFDTGFTIEGKRGGDLAGWSVSEAGDVNGDGIADLIIGSQASDGQGLHVGEAYVIFGRAGDFRDDLKLSSLSAANGFIIRGRAATHDMAGYSVSSAGDFDHDGFDDIIVGTGNAEEAYLIFGMAGASRTIIDASHLSHADGFTIRSGTELTIRAGQAVSSGGDVNGDGFADIIIGASNSDAGGVDAGEVYVLFGRPRTVLGDVNLTMLSGTEGFAIEGASGGDNAGRSISAGDVNGDGFDDLLIGAPGRDTTYVLFGKAGASRPAIDLSALAATDGFLIKGAAGDSSGASLSSAGDVNGDGYDDILIGAPAAGYGGAAYIIFGQPGATRSNIDLSNDLVPGSPGGFVSDGIGASVSSAGDFNGDGFDDFIIGAPGIDTGGFNAGAAYLIYGTGIEGHRNIDLSHLSAADGVVLIGGHPEGGAGHSVSSAGDINGDGYDDVIVGAPRGQNVGEGAGEAYVIFGRPGQLPLPAVSLPDRTVHDGDNISFALPAETFFDPALGPISYNAKLADGGLLPAWLTFDPLTATFSGTPPVGGNDIFTVKVTANAGSGTASGTFAVAVVNEPEWRLFAKDSFSGEVGGSGQVFGTAGLQDIKVLDVLGTVTFDPSFNRGGDVVRLTGDAGNWLIVGSGSNAILSDGDTLVTLPLGTAGLSIVFDDGVRLLRYDSSAGSAKIGSQSFGDNVVHIIALADGSPIPTGIDPAAAGRLFMATDGDATAGGNLAIFGTNGHERITLTQGHVTLDPSFNRGGDLLAVDQPASDFLASRSGSSVFLDGSSTEIVVPVGPVGLTVVFSEGDDRLLHYDAALSSIIIENQQLGLIPVTLSPFA